MANQVLWGFRNLKDVFSDRLTTVDGQVVRRAIEESVAEHNRQMNAVMGLFAGRTTDHMTRYQLPGTHRLQPLDENGRARPVKFAGYYDVAWPIHDAGTAWGANFKALAKMSVEDANRVTAEMLKADRLWTRDQLLAALFAAATYVYSDPQHGDLTVQPLALAGDGVLYARTGATAASTDTHQLAQAAAIADADDPFPAIYAELSEHPDNGGDVVALIPTNLKTAVTGLTLFEDITDPNIRRGADNDALVGTLNVALPGELLGYHRAKVWVAEWKALPDDYIVATVTAPTTPALAMREEPEAELQGFRQVATRDDHPFYERQWARYAGFGGWNRVGALVYRIGNATYAPPTGFAPPIP